MFCRISVGKLILSRIKPDLYIISDAVQHAPHCAMDVEKLGIDGIGFTECVAEYQKRGVTVYERINTSIYSKRIVEALGLCGAIRVSPMHCHGREDIDEFLQITAEIAEAVKRN